MTSTADRAAHAVCKRVACWISGGNATADSLRRALERS